VQPHHQGLSNGTKYLAQGPHGLGDFNLTNKNTKTTFFNWKCLGSSMNSKKNNFNFVEFIFKNNSIFNTSHIMGLNIMNPPWCTFTY
jgi:hypothetical protein